MNKKREKNKNAKEDNIMSAGTALKMDASTFNKFLQANKEKINSIVPNNPSIAKDDEWRLETFWDESVRENKNR